MIPAIRQLFNQSFTESAYQRYQDYFHSKTGITPPFRLAETPVFVPASFTQKMTDTCSYILSQISQPDFNEMTKESLPSQIGRAHV